MKNCGNLFSASNSWEFFQSSLRKDEEHLPLATSSVLLNTVDSPGPQMKRFSIGVGVSSVGGDVGGAASEIKKNNPRGRPRGSKNKPKDDLDNQFPMKLVVHEIPPGSDVVNWVSKFAQYSKDCVNILSGSGLISLVEFSKVGSHLPPSTIAEHLSLVSISGSFLCSSLHSPSSSLLFRSFLTVSLVGLDGKIFGGMPVRMIAMSPVVLMVTTFSNPEIYQIGTKF